MLLQFKVVQDSSLWSIDTDKRRYARLARSLVDIVGNPTTDPAVEEFGELKLMHSVMEVFMLEGRTPSTDGPGAGLTSVCIVVRIADTMLEVGVMANVEIAEPVMVNPINNVRCEVLGVQKAIVN